MNNKLLHFGLVSLGSFLVFMAMNVLILKTSHSQVPAKIDYSNDIAGFVKNFCNFGDDSQGGNSIDAMSVDDLRAAYLEATNKFFNENIEKLMTNEAKVAQKKASTSNENPEDTLGIPPSLTEVQKDNNLKNACPDGDYGCTMLYACNKDRTNPAQFNYSTYCVAQNALGFSPQAAGKMTNLIADPNNDHLKQSYFCYKAALEYKVSGEGGLQEALGNSIEKQCDTNSKYKNEAICKFKKARDEEKDPQKKASLQYQLDQAKRAKGFSKDIFAITDSVNERIIEINDEVERSKRALDQTLSAYNQLQTAWRMHVRYAQIFNLLVKYRDHLVEVRKQTDTFPLKFVDATTTRCL